MDVREDGFAVTLQCWEPKSYVDAMNTSHYRDAVMFACVVLSAVNFVMTQRWLRPVEAGAVLVAILGYYFMTRRVSFLTRPTRYTPLATLVEEAGRAVGTGGQKPQVDDMLVGGSGASDVLGGVPTATETVQARYVVNCAGGASDKVAAMIGDDSFKIKPRVGDYILLNRNQVCISIGWHFLRYDLLLVHSPCFIL